MKTTIKSLTNDIINKYINLVDTAELQQIIYDAIQKEYDKGLQQAEMRFNRNFLPDQHTLNFVQKYSFDNVTDMVEDMKENLRKEVSRALMNQESTSDIKKRIKDVMNDTITRAKMIQVTEMNRANNMGHHQGAKESGLDLVKRWDAQPERVSRAGNEVPCPTCEYLDNKTVGVDDHFTTQKGEKLLLPPAHPNCACRAVYVQREDT